MSLQHVTIWCTCTPYAVPAEEQLTDLVSRLQAPLQPLLPAVTAGCACLQVQSIQCIQRQHLCC